MPLAPTRLCQSFRDLSSKAIRNISRLLFKNDAKYGIVKIGIVQSESKRRSKSNGAKQESLQAGTAFLHLTGTR